MDLKGGDEKTYEDEVDSQRFLHPGSEGKLRGSKEPGVQTRLQDLPTILCKTSTLSPEGKNGHWVDFAQLPAGPSLWLISRIPAAAV